MGYKRISPQPIIEGGTGAVTLGSTQILIGAGTGAITSTSNATINTGTGAITLNSGTGALGISTDASATTVTIATGGAVKTATFGSTNSTSATTIACGTGGALFGTSANAHATTLGSTNSTSATTVQSGSGALNVTATGGALTINSGVGALSVSNDASATTLTIGTGGAAKTVTLGSTNTTSATTINSGTGALDIGTSIAKTITIGNTTGATAVNVNIGTGDFTMTSATGTLISQLDTGEMTRPLQPAFFAYLASDDANVTGNAAAYVLGTNVALTEVFDLGSDFNTNGTFTAPVTGRYILGSGIRTLQTIGTSCFITIVTSNRELLVADFNPTNVQDAGNSFNMNGFVLCDMDAADIAQIRIQITGGAGNTVDLDGNANAFNYFSGSLYC